MRSRFDLIVHPVRLQILHAFGGGDLVLTHDELVARLSGMSPAMLEEHLGILLENGILARSGEGRETRYRVDSEEARIGPGDIRQATPADHLRYFTTFVAGLIENFSRLIRRPNVDVSEAGVSYRQATLHLDKEERERLSAELEEVFERYAANTPGGQRRPMVVTRIIMPEALSSDES
jgi:DNA-binding transcriptional ArsR family regulator